MKRLLILIGLLVGMFSISCHDVTVGYLDTGNAGYDPDSMVVKKVLDVDSVRNPDYDTYWSMAEMFYQSFGYNTVQECYDDMFGFPKYDYSEDYYRWRLDIPWLSTKIQGVKGTQPLYVEIKDVTSADGEADALRQVLTVRGDGMLTVPLDVSAIPNGRYEISLRIYNEGYSNDVDKVFTIIVVDK